MEEKLVIKALAALAQSNRLQIFRMLVVKGIDGLTPALLAEQLGIPAQPLDYLEKALTEIIIMRTMIESYLRLRPE